MIEGCTIRGIKGESDRRVKDYIYVCMMMGEARE